MDEYTPATPQERLRAILRKPRRTWVNVLLFVFTFITTTYAGMEWITGTFGPYDIASLANALPYSLSIIFILGAHEFGHYFAARAHKVDATLPFFIPFPPLPGFLNFGTMGAVIKTRSVTPNNKALLDIGMAGPLAGFVASLIVLIYGFTHLPDVSYILNIHPDYYSASYPGEGTASLEMGGTLLYNLLQYLFTNPSAEFVPPMSEMYHYPYLLTGWFGLFVTAMNMIPVGQLDGGHIIFGMFGEKVHNVVSHLALLALAVFGIAGILDAYAGTNLGFGWAGWFLWGVILVFVIKPKHPPVPEMVRVGTIRMILGIITIIILFLSFAPNPFVIYML
jgi:membrane-associated protease RseP (regulator of RpoE activity)